MFSRHAACVVLGNLPEFHPIWRMRIRQKFD